MEKEEKKEDWKIFIVLILMVILALAGYLAGKSENNNIENPLQVKVDSLLLYSNEKEAQFNKTLDSVSAENSALKRSNTRIDKFLIKLSKKNEQNKNRTINANDSVKFSISDSILRANGYR